MNKIKDFPFEFVDLRNIYIRAHAFLQVNTILTKLSI